MGSQYEAAVDYLTLSATGKAIAPLQLLVFGDYLTCYQEPPKPGRGGYLVWNCKTADRLPVAWHETPPERAQAVAYVQIDGAAAHAFIDRRADALRAWLTDHPDRAGATRFDVQLTTTRTLDHAAGPFEFTVPDRTDPGRILALYRSLDTDPDFKRVVDHRGNDADGHTCYIGRRGRNGTGLFIRIYDKGAQESGSADYRFRFEVEYGKAMDRARSALVAYLDAGRTQEWILPTLRAEWEAVGRPLPDLLPLDQLARPGERVPVTIRGKTEHDLDSLILHLANNVRPMVERLYQEIRPDLRPALLHRVSAAVLPVAPPTGSPPVSQGGATYQGAVR